jgi:hypothetical protein
MFLGKNNNKNTVIASMNIVKVKQPTVESLKIVFYFYETHVYREKLTQPQAKGFFDDSFIKKNRDSLGKFSNAYRTRDDMPLRGFLSQ